MTHQLKSLIAVLLFIPCIAGAQNVVMNVRSRTTVSAGQTFQITFDVNAQAQNFRMPSLKGLTHVGGPSTGYSSSTSIVNGKMSQSVSNTFTILVQADKEGTANVGSASCTVDGKTVSSKPFSIKVEKANPNNNRQSQQQAPSGWPFGNPSQPSQQPSQQPAQSIDNNSLFARASINKSNLYQGEEAIIVYKIYTQVPLTQFQIDKLPRNKGFWSEDLSENMTQVRQYSETYNGKQYHVAEIRRGALYPQESGKLAIAPLKTDVVAIIQTRMQQQRTGTILDFFIDDPFFTPTRQQAVVKSLSSNAISVNVKPLPEAPASFAGGVGNFKISAKSDIKELHANEAFTYSVTVSGRGNLSLLEAPVFEFPKGMVAYEPRIVDNIIKGDNGLSGSRTFEWVVTPQTQGDYDMPAFDYSYFDPSSGQYHTVKCNAIHIKVGKPVHTAVSKSDVKELNSDIHHIVTSAKLRNNGASDNSVVFWILLALAAAVSAGVVIALRTRQRVEGDEASLRLQRATKLARKRLRNAERHLRDSNDDLFYEEIYKALWGGIADKFNIQQSLLSSETIQRHLDEKNVSADLQRHILQTLADVDFARFAPGNSSAKKQSIFNEAMNTITEISAIRMPSPRGRKAPVAILALLMATTALTANASLPFNPDSLFNAANSSYDSGDYASAANGYSTLIDHGITNWEVYYNLGNAYYRLDELGLSILNYERAARISPREKIVSDNLALAHSKTTDNIEVLPQLFITQWANSISSLFSPKGWRTVIVVLFFLLCASLTLFLVAKRYELRKRLFIISAILLCLTIFSIVNATISHRNLTNVQEAIVTSPMVVVKGAPDQKSVDRFLLHEGTKLTITDRQDNWWEIKIADGKSGWISEGATVI